MLRFKAILVTIAVLAIPSLAHATPIFGSLANFDSVNDTGFTARGFEIELEGINKSQVTDVFGLNRNFGTSSPGDVERYGLPTVTEYSNTSNVTSVRIVYQATYTGSGNWSTGTASTTPTTPFTTYGESCWSFGNIGYPNVPCDHFGVSTFGNPTKTTYSWLIDKLGDGALTPMNVAIPSVTFTPPPAPPAPGNPQPVNAVIQAVAVDPVVPKNNAFWVKIVQTSLPENVDLNDLMGGKNNVPDAYRNANVDAIEDLEIETEIEWQVLQPGKADEVSKAVNLGDPSLVVRFEFYKYLGTFDDDGVVDPKQGEKPIGDTLNEFVGDYVGMQIAGFNADQPLAPAAPEPATLALLGLGLAGLGLSRRKSAQA